MISTMCEQNQLVRVTNALVCVGVKSTLDLALGATFGISIRFGDPVIDFRTNTDDEFSLSSISTY